MRRYRTMTVWILQWRVIPKIVIMVSFGSGIKCHHDDVHDISLITKGMGFQFCNQNVCTFFKKTWIPCAWVPSFWHWNRRRKSMPWLDIIDPSLRFLFRPNSRLNLTVRWCSHSKTTLKGTVLIWHSFYYDRIFKASVFAFNIHSRVLFSKSYLAFTSLYESLSFLLISILFQELELYAWESITCGINDRNSWHFLECWFHYSWISEFAPTPKLLRQKVLVW